MGGDIRRGGPLTRGPWRAGGIDGIIVENASDMPFARPEDIGPETVSALTAACVEVRSATDVPPIGITCVANGVIPALRGGQGRRCPLGARQPVGQRLRGERGSAQRPGASGRRTVPGGDPVPRTCGIFADVHVKFGAHAITADRSTTEQATDAEWFDADVLIATGTRTGSPTRPQEVTEVRSGTNLPVVVGSGLGAPSRSRSCSRWRTGRSSASGWRRTAAGGTRSTPGGSRRLMEAVANLQDGP